MYAHFRDSKPVFLFSKQNLACLLERRYIKMRVVKCKNYIYFSECMLSYGENCQFPCSVHCINQTCNRKNGSCLYGCEDGYQCDKGIFSAINVIEILSFHFVYIDSLNLE